jgi:hypothetical protein
LDWIVLQRAGFIGRHLPVSTIDEKDATMHSLQRAEVLLNPERNLCGSLAQALFEGAGSGHDDSIPVQYLGHQEVAIKGRCTGTEYRFTPVVPVQPVDPRDAFHLLEDGSFGIAL